MNFSSIKSFFWDNNTTKQTIFKNTFWLTISEVVSRTMTFFLFVYVARILGATEYGKFAFALSIIYLFSVFHGFLSSQIITREISRNPENEKEFSSILFLKLLFSVGTAILIIVISFLDAFDPIVRKTIWILAIYNLFNGFFDSLWAFLRARQMMQYESFMKILQAFLLFVLGMAVVSKFPSIMNLSYSYLFATVLALVISLFFFHFKVHPLSLKKDTVVWKRILKLSWPLALVSTFSAIYNQTDTAMMGLWGQITEVGWYNAAYRIIGVVIVPITLISTSFYPGLCRSFVESKEKLQKFWDSQMKMMTVLALPIMVGGFVIAPKVIDFIYDESFFPAILSFQILALMAGLLFLSNTFHQGLIVADRQNKFFWVIFAGALINVVLNFFLIPEFSLNGAAIATLATNFIVLCLLIYLTVRFTTINPFNSRIILTFLCSALASFCMYIVLVQPEVYKFHAIILFAIGFTVYSAILFLLKLIFKSNL